MTVTVLFFLIKMQNLRLLVEFSLSERFQFIQVFWING